MKTVARGRPGTKFNSTLTHLLSGTNQAASAQFAIWLMPVLSDLWVLEAHCSSSRSAVCTISGLDAEIPLGRVTTDFWQDFPNSSLRCSAADSSFRTPPVPANGSTTTSAPATKDHQMLYPSISNWLDDIMPCADDAVAATQRRCNAVMVAAVISLCWCERRPVNQLDCCGRNRPQPKAGVLKSG